MDGPEGTKRGGRQPLRKVVAEIHALVYEDPGSCVTIRVALREILECGHMVPAKADFYGRTNAVRRRCRRCAEGRPADVSLWPRERNDGM